MSGVREIYRLLCSLDHTRQRLRGHEVYRSLRSIDDVRVFMEHHVFAVWDFMCLLKALQQRLTCVSVPWLPKHSPLARRLINEIVTEEESDEIAPETYTSHFELYRSAMVEADADTTSIDRFIALLEAGGSVTEALEGAHAPVAARAFVENTWRIVEGGSASAIAAAFCFGREDPIPGMFRTIVSSLELGLPGQLALFAKYLDRHIDLDEGHHSPKAVEVLAGLCQDDPEKWREANAAALGALEARIDLWDAVVDKTSCGGIAKPHRAPGGPEPGGLPGPCPAEPPAGSSAVLWQCISPPEDGRMDIHRGESELRSAIAAYSKRDVSHLSLDDDLVEVLNIDSLNGLELLAAVEERFDVTFPDEQISELRTLRRLLGALDASKGARAP